MAALKLFLLGAPRIEIDGQPVKLASRKTTALLAFLAMSPQPQRRETLLSMLWPEEDPSHGRALLRRTLSGLKTALPPGWLVCDRETIHLQPGGNFWLDVLAFRQLTSAYGNHGHPSTQVCPACEPDLVMAVALYNDDFMRGFSLEDSVDFDDWQLLQTEMLRQDMLSALGKLVDCLTQKGDYPTALPLARRRLALDPLNETAHCDLMRLYVWTHQRGAALRQFQECKELLSSQLGTDPLPATLELGTLIEAGRFPAPTPIKAMNSAREDAHPVETRQRNPDVSEVEEARLQQFPFIRDNNLPLQLTSFIGREKEIAEVRRLLAAAPARLVTLTGAGGTGKTRLALQVGSELQLSFTDGVWLLELASLTDPELVPQALVKVFGLSENTSRSYPDILGSFLKQRRLLLILDNCEHLVDACARLAKTLLQSSIGLRILATSRQRLGMEGEVTFYVPPLSSPLEGEAVETSDLARYEATLLFIERAQTNTPEFRPSGSNARKVGEICRRLDGIPLAIELAAARTRVLSVDQLNLRLADVFHLLVSGDRTAQPRHKTLRATIDWGYDLSDDLEQVLLQELSVFAGGWTMEAAEAVCTEAEVLDRMERLVDLSMVQVTGGTPPRFRMLETISQYAGEKLEAAGRTREMRARHLEYFLALAEKLELPTRSSRQIECLNQLEQELDNLRIALRWALENDLEGELRLASALIWLWHLRSHRREGCEWLGRGLEKAEKNPVRLETMAKALYTDGHLWIMAGRRDDLDELNLLESTRISRTLGDIGKAGIANALSLLDINSKREALVLYQEGGDPFYHGLCLFFLAPDLWDLESGSKEARQMMEDALAIFTQLGDPDMIASVNMWLGAWACDQNEPENGIEFYKKSLEIHQQAGNWDSIANIQLCLGIAFDTIGDQASALSYYQEVVNNGRRLESPDMIGAGLCAMGHSFLLMGNTRRARACLVEALDFESTGLLSWYNTPIAANANLGVLAWEEGDHKQAGEYFSTAWELMKDDPYQRAIYYYLQGALLCAGKDKTEAQDRLRESLQFFRGRKLWSGMGLPLDGLARLAARTRPEKAARMFGAADKMKPYIKNLLYRTERAGREATLRGLKDTLSEERLAELWVEGQTMTPEEIIELALSET